MTGMAMVPPRPALGHYVIVEEREEEDEVEGLIVSKVFFFNHRKTS